MVASKTIDRDRKLPSLSLPSAPGGELRPVLVGGRQATVVLLLHDADCPACVDYLRQLSGVYPTLREWDGQVVVIAGSAEGASALAERENWPFPILADAEHRLTAALGLAPPAVVIADRWGEIHFSQAAETHELAEPKELAEWLRFLAIQCSP